MAGNISPNSGLRQGDPISPLLIILCSEYLSKLFQKAEDNDIIHGIKITRNAPAVSHLMYADDLLVMCRADAKEAAKIKTYFQSYFEWSGQEANITKSSILFSKNTRAAVKRYIKDIMGFSEMKHVAIYLGNAFVFSSKKTKEFIKLKERISKRLEG